MCKSNVEVYHTNDRLKIENFLETSELIISKDTNWLGSGMYFWDNLSNAKYWKNEKLRKRETTDIKIIKGTIFLEKMLDLTDEETVRYIDDIWSYISKFSEIKKIKIEKAELGRKLDVIFDFYKNISDEETKNFDYNVIKCLGSYRKNLMGSLDLFSESNLTLSNKIIYSVKENICIGKFEIIDEGGKNE
ncbi:hypothetical protein [Fusobacterium polymorphum]|uniref:hypothetical protein n=1 Tax=Fusobacterium nucleatum subsp. polymorphum TaxID=76857 RepID=UPI00300824EB